MVDTALSTKPGTCTLWTPWGPQIEPSKKKLQVLRRTIRKLGANVEKKQAAKQNEAFFGKPECAYDL